mmetsp:Transcript_37254/g.37734  ORF Transcript_37254/g.37734 Transcript_37254/m.37734 type:complete len:106 (+) Transcript_37254:507-824(+)
MLVGLGVTILVQSSSITTSTFTPLVGFGVHPFRTNAPYHVSIFIIIVLHFIFVCVDMFLLVFVYGCVEGRERENKTIHTTTTVMGNILKACDFDLFNSDSSSDSD